MPSRLDRLIAGLLPAVPRPIVKQVSRRYIAGEDLAAAIAVARELAGRKMRCTMDILGEHSSSLELARAATEEYLELLDRQAEVGLEGNVSIKLTQLGLLADREACLANMRDVVQRAAGLAGKVRIDMEDSRCTDATLWVFRELAKDFDNVGVVLQAYLYRTLDDVAALAALRPDYRLCKGIYLESPAVAIQDPAAINRNYLKILGAMWDGGCYVGIATHDGALIGDVKAMIAERGLGPDRYEFQMLLGVQESLRDALLAEGYPLRVYLPYGRAWYTYSMRRLKENPSIAGHVVRNLLGLS